MSSQGLKETVTGKNNVAQLIDHKESQTATRTGTRATCCFNNLEFSRENYGISV